MAKHLKILIVTACYPFPRHKYGTNNINLQLMQPNEYYSADILSLYNSSDEKFIDLESEYDSSFIKINADDNISKYRLFLPWLISALPYSIYRYKQYWREVARRINEIASEYDLLHFSTSHLLPVINLLPESVRNKVICSPVDSITLFTRRRFEVEKNIIKKIIFSIELNKAKKYEKSIYTKVQKLIFASNVDISEMQSIGLHFDPIEIPNGVDCTYFQRNNTIQQEPKSLIFTGNMSYQPNKDCVLFILKTLYPVLQKKINDIKIYIVGDGADPELLSYANENIFITGFVKDIREYIGKASICISPLQYSGGGYKNKVLEAMAMSKIVIGSGISFEGINGVNNVHFIQIENFDPQNWSVAIIDVLTYPNKYCDIGSHARDLIWDVFSWDRIRKMYSDQYAEICNRNFLRLLQINL